MSTSPFYSVVVDWQKNAMFAVTEIALQLRLLQWIIALHSGPDTKVKAA
jgi:hypothetical protein